MRAKPFKLKTILYGVALTSLLSGCASLNGYGDQLKGAIGVDETDVAEQIIEKTPQAQNQWDSASSTLTSSGASLPSLDWVDNLGGGTLSALVQEALNANPSIRSAGARVRAAQSSAKISKGTQRDPRVSISSRLAHSEFGNDKIEDQNNLSIGPNLSWEADLWGKLSDTVKVSELEAQASQTDYAAIRLSIAGQVSQGWFNLLEAKLNLDLAQKSLETQERAQRLTQARFESGLIEASDVRLARSAVASAKANLALRRSARAQAARQLEIFLRRYPSDTLAVALDLPSLPSLTGIASPSDILSRRPDLIAAQQRLSQQGLQIDIANKALLPTLSFTGDGTFSAGDLSKLFDIDNLIATLAANIAAPLYINAALKGDIERNEAVLEAQIEDYANLVLQAYLEVENALDSEQYLALRESALREALIEAQKAESRLSKRYLEGLASILQLLDSQSRAINAESALISARKERLANRVRLHLALGGGKFGTLTSPNNSLQIAGR